MKFKPIKKSEKQCQAEFNLNVSLDKPKTLTVLRQDYGGQEKRKPKKPRSLTLTRCKSGRGDQKPKLLKGAEMKWLGCNLK